MSDEEDEGGPDDVASALAAASDFIIEVHKGLPAELEADARRTKHAAELLYTAVGETITSIESSLEGALTSAYSNCTLRVHKALEPAHEPRDKPPPSQ